MTLSPPVAGRVLEGPSRIGSELCWRIRDGQGQELHVAQLVPELAEDPAVRRRYVGDLERLSALRVEGLAPVVARGPQPGGPEGAPWRARATLEGATLDAWIARRAPGPPDEAAALVAELADVVHRVHGQGMVLRGLHPRHVHMVAAGVVLADVGLARVDVLSSRTAASLILEGSPYVAPEQLVGTTVDPRVDVFSLGAILWHMVLGAPPWGDTAALLRRPEALPDPGALRGDLPPTLGALLLRCLAHDPGLRPGTAAVVAGVLRGRGGLARVEPTAPCQACGAVLRVGQRICVSCGREAVAFHSAPPGRGVEIELKHVEEDVTHMQALREMLSVVSDGDVPPLNFIVGDTHMYSKRERAEGLRLPAKLFEDVQPESARALVRRMKDAGLHARARDRSPGALRSRLIKIVTVSAGGFAAFSGVVALLGHADRWPWLVGPLLPVWCGLTALIAGLVRHEWRKRRARPALLRLRAAPAALAASDPLVRRLGELLQADTAADVRAQVGELALWVQRLVDHRGSMADGGARAEAGLADEVVQELVARIEAEVQGIEGCDRELATLDEGGLVRELAREQARGAVDGASGGGDAALAALDRLRALEELRAAAMHRLLGVGELLRRAVSLGLEVRDEAAEHERLMMAALRGLEAPGGGAT